MNKLFIHIGTHKTGTSSIQHALKSSSKYLKSSNLFYINCQNEAKLLMQANSYQKPLVENFRLALNKKSRSAGYQSDFVLSSEALSGAPLVGYSNVGIVARMLRDATRSFDVRIILYLRRQDEFIESMYAQHIQEGESCDFDYFLQGFSGLHSLCYKNFINRFAEQFGVENLIVRSYHLAKNRGLVQDFQEVIGWENCHPGDRLVNPSFSANAIEIAKKVNQTLNSEKKKKVRLALQKAMPKNKNYQYSHLKCFERKKILVRFEDSNRWVADNFFGKTIDDVFGVPLDHYEVHPPDISVDEVVHLILEILSSDAPARTNFILTKLALIRKRSDLIKHILRVINFR